MNSSHFAMLFCEFAINLFLRNPGTWKNDFAYYVDKPKKMVRYNLNSKNDNCILCLDILLKNIEYFVVALFFLIYLSVTLKKIHLTIPETIIKNSRHDIMFLFFKF